MRLALPSLRRALPFVGALLTLTACLGSDTTAVPNIPSNPAVETYASATGVVISNMTKVNDNLFIQDLTVGTGKVAAAGDTISVFYTGWIPKGTVFDSNVGKTVLKFPLGAGFVIPGWDLGVVGMRVGGKRKLVIGSSLAYANQSPDPSRIPQNSTLVFDVELTAAK